MATAIIIPGLNGAGFARVVAAPANSGSPVTAGQTVLEIENHKVVQEIEAPVDGIILHELRAGDLVRVDVPVAFIASSGEHAPPLIAESRTAKLPHEPSQNETADPESTRTNGGGTPLSVAKATEVSVLGNGAGNSLLATLGIQIGQVPRAPATPSFFSDKILDLIVYETSRLLSDKKFLDLNARFEDGKIIRHERVVVGVSFDDGGRLTTCALNDADKSTLSEVQDKIVDALMRYVGRKLSARDVTSATVTITDTSAAELALSVPLLPRGQCIIISITKDRASSFHMSISYDHRITEGLTVSAFAGELARRVRSYGAPEQPVCAYCERSAASEISDFRRRGLLRVVDASGQEAWCCATCWENW